MIQPTFTIEKTKQQINFALVGIGVTCSPRDPRFTGSNPTNIYDFFLEVKILSTSPPGGNLGWGFRVCDFRLVEETQV